MAEELRDASYTLPWVMIWATVVNGGMMFAMAVTIAYCIGDLDAGEKQSSGFLEGEDQDTFADHARSLADTDRISIHPDLLQRHWLTSRN